MTRPTTVRPRRKVNHIEVANNKTDEEFLTRYVPSMYKLANVSSWHHPKTEKAYSFSLRRAIAISDKDINACFNLIDHTSGDDYRASSLGWHPGAKKKEMRSPDLRYILVRDTAGDVKGFASLMPTFENGEAVVYCYEIHLQDELQGTGLGKLLMGYLLEAGEAIDTVEKVMLTCFVSNRRARTFYEKLGFVEDDYSPPARKLRGGKTVVPDHVILSRRTKRA